eukprot:358226-Chlamydomonas_euryale.AAC.2
MTTTGGLEAVLVHRSGVSNMGCSCRVDGNQMWLAKHEGMKKEGRTLTAPPWPVCGRPLLIACGVGPRTFGEAGWCRMPGASGRSVNCGCMGKKRSNESRCNPLEIRQSPSSLMYMIKTAKLTVNSCATESSKIAGQGDPRKRTARRWGGPAYMHRQDKHVGDVTSAMRPTSRQPWAVAQAITHRLRCGPKNMWRGTMVRHITGDGNELRGQIGCNQSKSVAPCSMGRTCAVARGCIQAK